MNDMNVRFLFISCVYFEFPPTRETPDQGGWRETNVQRPSGRFPWGHRDVWPDARAAPSGPSGRLLPSVSVV